MLATSLKISFLSLFFLQVVARFENKHTHPVDVFWMKGQRAESQWVMQPGAVERRLVREGKGKRALTQIQEEGKDAVLHGRS
jgi:hypothetical protein